ncbi:MAG: molybdenum cofactor guanylyltransferase MobA [Proteobacteria bacterium]|nr:MAG: molybdenum cofactor guanylyltransferase MobA [Pseudomonadota bacterium]
MSAASHSVPPQPATLGVILAGGRATRMGGGDKPLRTVGGRSILDRVVARLKPQCEAVIVSANGDPSRFAALALPVVADTVPGQPGPLGGVLAALDWCSQNRPDIDWLLSAPGDCPFLPDDLAARLHAAALAHAAPLAVATSGDRSHPVIALWSLSLHESLRHALTVEDMRRAHDFVARHRAARVAWPTMPFDPFFNVNTADDLARAERLISLHQRQ